jgi:hypothetical protein
MKCVGETLANAVRDAGSEPQFIELMKGMQKPDSDSFRHGILCAAGNRIRLFRAGDREPARAAMISAVNSQQD